MPRDEPFLILDAAGPDPLALLGDDRGRAGILAHRQLEPGGHRGVSQQRHGHAAIVPGRLGIVENCRDLGQVACPVQERDVAEGLAGQERERFGLDLEDLLALERRGRDKIGVKAAIGGGIRPQRERGLISELWHDRLLSR